MKNIFAILLFLVFTSCENQLNLNPISDAGSTGFYKNEGDFIQAINGVYATFGVQNNVDYPSYYVVLGESRSDNIYTPGVAGVRDWNSINNFQNTISTLGTISSIWNTTFNGIMRANTVIDQLSKNGDVITNETLKKRIEAEAKFLRAYFYFDLVKWFGKVPLLETFVSPEEALSIGRSDVSQVYKLIISDLEFAAENLPESYEIANQGRATKFAAKGILARVYLTRSGPILNEDGPCLASGEYDKALSLLNEIIASQKFSMLANYADIFSYENENNAEIIFDMQFISGGVNAGAYYPTEYYDEGWGRTNLPFPGGNPGDGSKRISDDLLSLYSETDKRLESTCLLGYLDLSGTATDSKFFDKFINAEKAGGDRFNWSINYPVLRYTDVLLLKAECILQMTGSGSEVDEIINKVRSRAGVEAITNANLTDLLNERRLEFAAENLRWDDLVRTGTVLETMNAFRAKEDSGNKMQKVTSDFIIYPIPQSQLEIKQGLYTQNKGYI